MNYPHTSLSGNASMSALTSSTKPAPAPNRKKRKQLARRRRMLHAAGATPPSTQSSTASRRRHKPPEAQPSQPPFVDIDLDAPAVAPTDEHALYDIIEYNEIATIISQHGLDDTTPGTYIMHDADTPPAPSWDDACVIC